MPQAINYDQAARVMYYHSIPRLSGTSEFEHTPMVALAPLQYDTNPHTGQPDTTRVLLKCPLTVPNPLTGPGQPARVNCGHVSSFPLDGDEEAQRLHARVRAANQGIGLPQAAQSVINDILARGGTPRITPQTA